MTDRTNTPRGPDWRAAHDPTRDVVDRVNAILRPAGVAWAPVDDAGETLQLVRVH